jgi:hypothetical protein
MRRIYIPDKGKIFVQCDQSGAEALIVAYLCREGKFRDLFLYNIKPHVYVALHMFKDKWKEHDSSLDIDGICLLEPKDITKHEQFKRIDTLIKSSDNWPSQHRYYYLAKQTCHSSNYGIKGPTFQMNVLEKSNGKIALSKYEAAYFLAFYRGMFPEIPRWNYETMLEVTKTRTLRNLFGHPRYFHGAFSDALYREAYAFVPQSTVAEITHKAYAALQFYIEDSKLDIDLLANTHDSYLVQCPIGTELITAKLLTRFMNQTLKGPWGDTFQMKSEVAAGYCWAPYKPKTCENGLKEIKL